MLRTCVTSSANQIGFRGFGSRAIGASNPSAMIARSMPLSSRRTIVASAWRGEGAASSGDLDDQPLVGRIEIITGPMFSGKSTELLRRAAEHEVKKKKKKSFFPSAILNSFSSSKKGKKERQKQLTSTSTFLFLHFSKQAAGRRVALVSSSKDTRYGVSSVVTHAGVARVSGGEILSFLFFLSFSLSFVENPSLQLSRLDPENEIQKPKTKIKRQQRCISVSRLSDLRSAIESSNSREKETCSVIEGKQRQQQQQGTATATAGMATTTSTPPPPPPLLPSLDSYDVIAIDEAQFFDDLVPFATAMADGRGGGGGGGEREERRETRRLLLFFFFLSFDPGIHRVRRRPRRRFHQGRLRRRAAAGAARGEGHEAGRRVRFLRRRGALLGAA